MAAALGRDVHRISVLARNRLLGDTRIDNGDGELATRSALFDRIVAVMGGTAAEELVLGQPSTGSEDDLARGTELALDLVGRYGMGEALGRLRLPDGAAAGGDGPGWAPSPETGARLDAELRSTVDRAFAEATALLSARAGLLTALTDLLLEKESSNAPSSPPRSRTHERAWHQARGPNCSPERPARISVSSWGPGS